MRMGIMGGTLDPVHNGHIAVARAVCEACGLDGVMLLPAGDPPHKQHRAEKADRWAMAQLAAGALDWMSASDLEIVRSGTTYTVDTLEQLCADRPGVEWVYIIGADTVNVLETWRRFDRVAGLCAFAAVGRPGFEAVSYTHLDVYKRQGQAGPRHAGHRGRQIVVDLDRADVDLALGRDDALVDAAGGLRAPLGAFVAGAGHLKDLLERDRLVGLIEQVVALRALVLAGGRRGEQHVAVPGTAVVRVGQAVVAGVGGEQVHQAILGVDGQAGLLGHGEQLVGVEPVSYTHLEA